MNITAPDAFLKAQNANRNHWVERSLCSIESKIRNAANHGKTQIELGCINNLVAGSENLGESGEMLVLLQNALEKNGYKTRVDIYTGEVTVSWDLRK